MSASTEKKLRAQARAEGTDKKAIKAQEEAEKKAKSKRKLFIAIIAALVFIAVILVLNSDLLYTNTKALTIGDDSYSPAEVNYEYGSNYMSFLSSYGSYASAFGLDTSNGIFGLGAQECGLTGDGTTWRDYFKDQALDTLKEISGLCKYAEENDVTLTEEEIDEVSALFDGLDDTAQSYGYSNGEKYLAANFGKGVTTDVITKVETMRQLASKVYNMFLDEAAENDTEFEDYDMVNVRHILVKAVADEDGNYTEEAIATAKKTAEDVLAEFEAGERTEDAFIELAEYWSEDVGSNTNGGLYENIYKGEMVEEFDSWIFDSSRQPGDTGIVHGSNGSYEGYHVIYFVGAGDKYSTSSQRQSELASMITDKIAEISDSQEVKTTIFYNLVGKA